MKMVARTTQISFSLTANMQVKAIPIRKKEAIVSFRPTRSTKYAAVMTPIARDETREKAQRINKRQSNEYPALGRAP